MWIGIGIGINRNRYAQGIFGPYSIRVTADGGVTEAGGCVDAVSGLLLNASLLLIPSGYKGGKAYAQIPTNGNGDLTWTRASTALRTNSSGLLESMGSGVPRLDYSQGSCPALLLEPQRTNLFTYSGQLDDASWSKQGVTITANSNTAPDGTQSADLVDDGTAVSTNHWFFQSPTFAFSTTYTISFYTKYVSRKYMAINIFNGSTSQFVYYDIQNGSVVGTTGDVTASITSVGNGWNRVVYTRTIAASGSPNLRISLADDSLQIIYTGSNKQVLVWGAQLELGAYPTTYIPTTTASATRVADTASKTGISSLIGQTQGTIFFDVIIADSDNSSISRNIGGISDGTGANRIEIYRYNNTIQYDNVASGAVQFTGSIFTITNFNTTLKVAISYSLNNVKSFVNGALVNTDLSALIPACSEFGVGTNRGILAYGGHINKTALFTTALSDSQCQTLTTL